MKARTTREHRRRGYLPLACTAAAGLICIITLGPGIAKAHSAPSASSDYWPMFGHDPLHSGVSPDTTIGASTAPGLAEQWSDSLASTSNQPSPAVTYNATLKKTLVYDVTYTGIASAFNASTGALVWQRPVGAHVFSSPAVYGNTVYFGDNSGTLEALNAATGAVQCTFTLPVTPPDTKRGRIFSSPVVGDVDGSGPTVFFGDAGLGADNEKYNGGHFWAITGVGNTGGNCKLKWSYDNWPNQGNAGTMTGVWDEPALVQGSQGSWLVVFGTSNPDESVYALNAVTGSRLWRFPTLNRGPDEDVGAGPTISPPGSNGSADGVVYIDGKDGIEYALNLLTGKQIWSVTLGAGSNNSLAVSEAALTGNTLVLGYAGSVVALSASTGTQLWKQTPGGTVEASPAVAGKPGDQVLFVGDLNHSEYGFNVQNGAQVFSASTTGGILASAAIADGMLYFTSGGKLYAYAPETASPAGKVAAARG